MPIRILARQLRALGREEDGLGALELALLCPILIVLLIGVFDFSLMFVENARLNNAAAAGAQYALSNDRDSAGIAAAIAEATGLDTRALSVSTARTCTCLDGTSVSCSATAACGPGQRRRMSLRVDVVKVFDTYLPYPGLPDPLTLVGSASMQVQ